MTMVSFKRIAVAMAAFSMTSATHAAEAGFFNLTIERVLVQSDSSANVGQRGEVWIKVNSTIAAINAACPTSNWYSANGYLVAAYANDQHRSQMVAGLMAAKAAGALISGAVDDSKMNVSGICTLTWYEIQ